jgi:hypothetical protein
MAMIFRAFASLGVLFLTASFGCSEGDSDGANGAGGGGSGGSAQGGSKAQGGSAGNGSGKAGSSSAGTSTAGTDTGEGGETSPPGGGGAAGDPGSVGGAGQGEGGAPPDGGQVIADCLDAPVLVETRTEALELTGAGLTLAIVRRVDPDAFGTSGTTVWLAQRFGLVRGGVAECISDVAELDYTVSHHNFDDVMTASYGAETWLFSQTRQDYGFPAMFSLEARNGNAVVWGPVTLTLVSCQELLQGESCLTTYQE